VKQLLSGLLVLGLAFTLGVGATGCKKGPANNATTTADKMVRIDNFIFPTKVIVLEPGKPTEVAIKRKGKEPKDHQLKLTPSDAKLDVKGGKYAGDAEETTVTITAAKDAKPGDYTITVESGGESKKIDVKVEKAGEEAKAPAKYELEPKAVKAKQGEDVKVKVTREGGAMKKKDLEVKSSDPKITVEGTEFAADKAETTLVIKVGKDAKVGEATLKITAGDKEVGEIKVTVEKGKGASLNVPNRTLTRGTGQVEALPEPRASIRRELVLFTREL
jgi:hypothetical protein